MCSFAYHQPHTVAHAVNLATETPGARFIAGGTDLLVKMRRGALSPGALISLRGIGALRDFFVNEDRAALGAGVLVRDIAESDAIAERFPALSSAARALGTMQVRNMATLGGNLCNASPCADTAGPLLAYDARVRIAGPNGPRELPLDKFFHAPGETRLKRGELLEAILLDSPPPSARTAFFKHGRVAGDIAVASVTVLLVVDGGRCTHARVAAGSLGPRPLRLRDVERILEGAELTDDVIARARQAASEEVAPISDLRAGAGYRRHLAGVFVERGIARCLGRSAADSLAHASGSSGTDTRQPAPDSLAHASGSSGTDTRQPATDNSPLSFTLNGLPVRVFVRPGDRLLDVLREQLDQRGTKEGCGEGECGSCTVLLDGRAVCSCLTPAVEVHGREVISIEGLRGSDGRLSPVQQAMADSGGVQCGFCSSGMALSATDLLSRNAAPTRDDAAAAIAGNLCRCTGYTQIIDAVLAAARIQAREAGGENSHA